MNPIDYDAVLEDLRAKRDELNTAIAAIERITRGGAPGPAVNGEAASGAPPQARGAEEPTAESKQVREDAFFGLSATAAARKYLIMVKRPVVTQDLVDALKQGGLLTNAKNFYSNLYTSLKRSEEFTNLGRGKWGLTEWYPNRPRKKVKGGGAAEEAEESES
jgi:hypothetical protein